MTNASNRQASIDSRRIDLEREISIRVPRFDTFVTEYSQNISTTGMFIVSEQPQPPGTTFSFEFSVADDWKLIRGKAQVVWTRYRSEGPERPAGMGVRFVELDAQSRRLIRWIVEKHIREGGTPFELDDLRNVIDEALEEVEPFDTPAGSTAALRPPAPTRPKPEARPRPTTMAKPATTAKRPPAKAGTGNDRNMVPLLATAGAVVLALALLFWLTEWIPKIGAETASEESSVAGTPDDAESTPGEQDAADSSNPVLSAAARSGEPSAEINTEPTAEVPATPEEGPSGVEVATAVPEAPASVAMPPLGSAYPGVRDTVTSWADAWSAQDADRYLEHYSEAFEPGGALSLPAWRSQRRQRLVAPEFINVSVSQLDMQRVDDARVQVTFFQAYRSNRFSDEVQKTLDLVWERGAWKIWREVSR